METRIPFQFDKIVAKSDLFEKYVFKGKFDSDFDCQLCPPPQKKSTIKNFL